MFSAGRSVSAEGLEWRSACQPNAKVAAKAQSKAAVATSAMNAERDIRWLA
jgi:hypothetical protein